MKKHLLFFSLTLLTIMSCQKELTDEIQHELINNEALPMKSFERILIEAAHDPTIVTAMSQIVESSRITGLDESVYLEDVLFRVSSKTKSNDTPEAIVGDYFLSRVKSPNKISTKSETDYFTIGDLEIYWPYSDDWDGSTEPVVVFNVEGENNYIEGDKTYAYRISGTGANFSIEELIVDESYAMKNPVWVVNRSNLSITDIDGIRNRSTCSGNDFVLNTKSIQDNTYRLNVTEITSGTNHDDWMNGGSEYIIFWFTPVHPFGLISRSTEQIKFTRKESKNKTTKTVNLIANPNWSPSQEKNMLKVIEFDPGKNINYTVKLLTSLDALAGSYETTISINNQDDDIIKDVPVERTSIIPNSANPQSGDIYTYAESNYGVTISCKLEVL